MTTILPYRATDADERFYKFPAYVQPKIDGVRGIHLRDFTGRTLKKFKNRHVTDFYSHPALFGLDGELIKGTNPTAPDLCRATTSVVNTISGTPETSWHLFDFVTPTTIRLPYRDRREILCNVVQTLEQAYPEYARHLHIVPAQLVTSAEEINHWLQEYLNLGYEGIIIRTLAGMHKNGYCTEREANFLRIKDFGQEEAIVIGIEEAMENCNEAVINKLGKTERSSHQENKVPKGMLGALICENARWGRFVVGPGKLTHEERIDYWSNPSKIVGETITYKFLKTGCKDKPRMATFQHIRAWEDL
jgi:hypothetical protein